VIRLELERIDPCIWRVVRVPATLPLAELDRVLQIVLGWSGGSSHAFEMRSGAHLDEQLTIDEVLNAAHDSLTYTYDNAGSFRVRITRAPGVWRARAKTPVICLDGYLAGPRDDAGGPAGYSAVLAATMGRGPGLTDAQRQKLGPNFDPERFDRGGINRALAELFARETAATAAAAAS
jgi:hypothetical protein